MAPAAMAQSGVSLDRYVGTYELNPKLVLTITHEGDHLAAQATHQPKLDLTAQGGDEFSVNGVSAQISFKLTDGAVTGLVLHQNGREVTAPRIDAATAARLETFHDGVVRTWPVMQGVTEHVLTSGAAIDYWPAFSPDGKTILFSRTTDGKHWSMWKVPAAGGSEQPFAELPVSATRPAWSAKNNLIAFTGTTEDRRDGIWTVNPDGSGAKEIAAKDLPHLFYPSWDADGKSVVAVSFQPQALFRVEIASGKTAPLTDQKDILPGMPCVSPDGTAIVFAGQKNTGQPYDQNANTLWLLDKTGTHQLEAQPHQGRAPVWSPNGKWIFFESNRASPDGRYAVFAVRRDGTGLVQITDYARNANHPVLSEDQRHIVVTVGTGAGVHVAVLDLPDGAFTN